MAGVTLQGFEPKLLAQVLTDAENQLALVTDPATGATLQPNLSSSDPAMQIAKVPLDGIAAAWEAMALVFQQYDPSKSVGVALSGLVELNGIKRQPATGSLVTLQLTGTNGTVIPAGSLVSDANNQYQWATLTAVTIPSGGTVTVTAQNQTVGPIAAAASTLTNIVTPVAGWTSVTNPNEAIAGRLEEKDSELRQRRSRSTAAPSAGPIESIYANLSNVEGVTYVRAYQNNTLATDSRGVPAKSVAAVVVGGDDLDIAYTLLARTGVTAQWFGTTTVSLFDAQDVEYQVKFSRPTPLPIYVKVQVRVTNPSVFPVDGLTQIRDAIVAYAAGGAPALGIDEGFSNSGFPPGAAILTSRLYTPINFVPGHEVVSLLVDDVNPPMSSADIPMAWNQYGQFLPANIEVVAVP